MICVLRSLDTGLDESPDERQPEGRCNTAEPASKRARETPLSSKKLMDDVRAAVSGRSGQPEPGHFPMAAGLRVLLVIEPTRRGGAATMYFKYC